MRDVSSEASFHWGGSPSHLIQDSLNEGMREE
jgi:hypothetical protein